MEVVVVTFSRCGWQLQGFNQAPFRIAYAFAMKNVSTHQSKVRPFLAVLAGLLSLSEIAAKDIPAFPGAEGHGTLFTRICFSINGMSQNPISLGLSFGAEFIPIYRHHPNANMAAICQGTESDTTTGRSWSR